MAESPEREQLRQRFRNVIALYRLVRCINEGYPSLPDSSAPKLEALPSRRNVLEAITTILVVDHEILAAASFSEATDDSQVSVTGSLVCVSSDEVVQELRNPRQSPLENANTEHTADIDLDFPLEIDTEGINTHSTKVVAISNPHTAHQKLPQFQFSSTNPQGLCLVKDGRDLWCMIKDDDEDTGWENIIQKLSTSQCQKQFESCWRKMHRRMTTWSSLGLLYNLAHIPTETLRKITNKRTVVFDQRLSRYLTILKESHSDVLFGYNPVTVEPRTEQIPRPNIALLQKTTGYNIIYNDAETAINFHQFFIHLLLGFVKALARLSKAMKRKVNESPDIKEITSAIASAAPIVRALVMVVHSDALETHLQTLRTTEAELRMPTIDSIPNYTKFAAANDLILGKGYKDAKGKGRDKGAKDEDKGVESRDKGAKDEDKGVESRDKGAKDEDKGVERRDMNTKGEGEGEGMNEGGTNDEDENENENGYPGYGEAEEDENADLVCLAYTADHTVLRRWIMTFVGHFSAKRILERHVTGAGLDKPVDIRLIAVKRAETTQERLTWGAASEMRCGRRVRQHRKVVDDSAEESAVVVGAQWSSVASELASVVTGVMRKCSGDIYHFPISFCAGNKARRLLAGSVFVGVMQWLSERLRAWAGRLLAVFGSLGVIRQLSECRGGACQGCGIIGNRQRGVVVVLGAEDERKPVEDRLQPVFYGNRYQICGWVVGNRFIKNRLQLQATGGATGANRLHPVSEKDRTKPDFKTLAGTVPVAISWDGAGACEGAGGVRGTWDVVMAAVASVRDERRERRGLHVLMKGKRMTTGCRWGRWAPMVPIKLRWQAPMGASGWDVGRWCDAEVVHEADMCCKVMRADGLRWWLMGSDKLR
ncbi:hypothetical protein F5887DRAFT_921448 [Amanita rubescens]|nr:hypothetical protein F5887DRAFT_921448 [Amanita rubescens]